MITEKNIENLKGGNKNLKELASIKRNGRIRILARLTLLNILSVQGVIYTHYKNKQLNKGKYEKTISILARG